MSKKETVLITGLFSRDIEEFTIRTILGEVISLVETAGGSCKGSIVQKGREPDKSFFLGKGKVLEVEAFTQAHDVDMVVFMNPLSSIQQRNLEDRLELKVLDRTRLILDIFAQHARTQEGKLQVELAQMLYLLPRLTGMGIELSRLGGGIGTRGPGETKLESDRRVIKKKISQVKSRLDKVRKNRSLQRKQRKKSPVPLVSIVGYTSAGKSTLFNLLTDAKVLASKKLFSTLDPLVRRVDLKESGEGYYCLMSDTVGFIRDMPKELITAFHATLEEVGEADIILLVSDISDPDHQNRYREVMKVLRTMNIEEEKMLRVFNKIDLAENPEKIAGMNKSDVYVSAKTGQGIPELKKAVFRKFFNSYQRFRFTMNSGDPRVKNISSWAIILNQTYHGEEINFDVLCDSEKMVEFQKARKET